MRRKILFYFAFTLFSVILLLENCSPKLSTENLNDPHLSLLSGSFVDDYGIEYIIKDSTWKMLPNYSYQILKTNENEQYLICKNGDSNPTDAGLYSRIDYMFFENMKDYAWGFCLSAFDSKSINEAEKALAPNRSNPLIGCNGFPFSRMKRVSFQ